MCLNEASVLRTSVHADHPPALLLGGFHRRGHLDAKLRRGLEASLVWTEIQSCLKGGLEALKAPRGRLQEADYVALSQT